MSSLKGEGETCILFISLIQNSKEEVTFLIGCSQRCDFGMVGSGMVQRSSQARKLDRISKPEAVKAKKAGLCDTLYYEPRTRQ